MAKNPYPVMNTGGGLLPKVIGTLVLIAVLTLVIKYPADAAHWVRGLGHVIDGLVAFLRALFG
ncbi:hypothetical protein FNH05_15240 [Amycolatopsis rhizosphaerae]|uniref:Uncharacterized protein n=1 Tax=Amycolatopsis rhizosphaerae TaxID=2053003 RepID=A0A558CPL6_9PSEU|nr:hypothetical protein [Amycolatopsis rhizosphaerae]TVT50719.1 hypothetical protein FNH05_15240 [Amycolatopsis rhizosphaerae]